MALRRYVPPALAALTALGLAGACTGDDERPRVRIGTVGTSDVAEVVEVPATVAARRTSSLRAPAEGVIRRLHVADGDRVRRGQVLARLDSPTAREQLAEARAADRAAGGSVPAAPAGVDLGSFQRHTDRTARRGFTEARRIAREVPDPGQRARVLAEITRAEADYAAAAAAARAAVARLNAGLGGVGAALSSITAAQRVQTRAAVLAAERTVEALTIRAPFAGVASLGGPAGSPGGLPSPPPGAAGAAGALSGLAGLGGAPRDAASIAEGAPVTAGDAVVTVTDVSRLTLSADVDETDVLRVDQGTPADVELDALPGVRYTAVVTGVGVTPQQQSAGGVTYRVTLSLGAGTGSGGAAAPRPKPGMSAVADLRVREARGVLSVPSAAVVTSGRETTVWVVTDGRARRRAVRLGAQGDSLVQVLGGLAPGERIVTSRVDTVEQGQEVP
ncbi:efflux transporter periplasmic adaptor subunit [Actinomadura craniellae]|uniref:Efflux transporter periplasmic adaptor subunit n=1 Tax=Actinomadura craniellae TaxID=2231787 RepID=A0A365H880_9ACTN|nr:efflux RND transporter periplasmic adaptor subunit [Actinomadura craniellae]RAY15315.1 efflux transporter periplasmic adaptor subunit [Actinomadura craniellae]